MIDTRVKLFISFFLIIAVTLMKHWYVPVLISILFLITALRLKAARKYCKKLIFPLVLGLFIFAIQSFTYGSHRIELGPIPVYSEGMEYGFLIFSRVFASASVLLILMLTTSRSDLLSSLHWFRVPKNLIEISSFMFRYVWTFLQEGKKLKFAQDSRCAFSGNSSFWRKMHNASLIWGALILRAFARSDEVYRAMLSRGWKPYHQYSGVFPKLRAWDTISGLILLSGIIGLVIFDWIL